MKLKLKVGLGKTFDLDIKKVGFLGKIFGLMFKNKNTKSLLFDFEKEKRWAIHSCFVFFDFLTVWLDSDDKIVEIKRVKPFNFCVKPKKSFKKLVEIPFNKNNERIIKLLVGKRKV